MDLGSGLGRVVLQMALACGHAFQRYIGLELSSTRLDQSEQVLSWLREELGRDPAAADALACAPGIAQFLHLLAIPHLLGVTECPAFDQI
ncbi:hypothetical protein HaLaN_23428 [Haematococcus lacustris]|uniref:Uncharacterized protein n=1 Tax=Haematococcus lacustris TaxID=44745 RepID=A0A699ZSZ7_HAELA|nr:hypothetical protein HaLaN_23428 [Haematococcus lacustris]